MGISIGSQGFQSFEYEESKKNAEESKKVNAEESKKPEKKDLVTAEESKVNAEGSKVMCIC